MTSLSNVGKNKANEGDDLETKGDRSSVTIILS